MRINDGNGRCGQGQGGFERLSQNEARKADREAQRETQSADRKEARQAQRDERREAREAMRPTSRPIPVEPDGGIGDGAGPIPVEPDGGIGDGAGPIPFPPEATTLAIGEEDGGGGFPQDPDGPFPIGGGPIPVEPDGGIGDGAGPIPIGPIPVEPDGGIGDGAGPIPFPPEATTLAVGEEDGGGGFPIGPGAPIGPTEPPTRGGGLLFLYQLGDNSLGADRVTLNTDGTGTVSGPNLSLTLSGGGYNDAGDWVATAGSGTINGEAVMLKQNADGNVFVASGEGGLADTVSAWIDGGRELNAGITAVAQP